MTYAKLGLTVAGLTLLFVGCAADIGGPDDAIELDSREESLTGAYRDGTDSFRYVDTHDGYAHTRVVDSRAFPYFKRVDGKPAVGLTMDCAWVEPRNANDVLDVLKREGIKITFFVAGQFVFKSPSAGLAGGIDPKNLPTIRRMIEDGHEFGSHSQTHPHNNATIDWTRQNAELLRGWNEAVRLAFNGAPIPANAKMLPYWRAPYGEYDERSLGLAAKAGFPNHFGWNVDVKDAVGFPACSSTAAPSERCLSARRMTDTVLEFAGRQATPLDGFVILSHLQNPYAWGSSGELRRLVTTLRGRGYTFAKLSQMFATPVGPAVVRPTPSTGATCAPGCIFSKFCVSRNPSAPTFAGSDGQPLICVKQGADCGATCLVAP